MQGNFRYFSVSCDLVRWLCPRNSVKKLSEALLELVGQTLLVSHWYWTDVHNSWCEFGVAENGEVVVANTLRKKGKRGCKGNESSSLETIAIDIIGGTNE